MDQHLVNFASYSYKCFLKWTIIYFSGYLILHFFHCFSAGNSPLNLDILIPLISFCRIFSALSKYVLRFCVVFFLYFWNESFCTIFLFLSICCNLKMVEIHPRLMHLFMLHMSSSITPINILHHYWNTLCMYMQGGSKLEVQTSRGDRTHHKDSELHSNPCAQTSF